MQLMPATARQVARQIDVPYSRARLTGDPACNVSLGQAYLAELLEQFDGSLVLALAAYNAGPARVGQWLHEYGSHGDSTYEVVAWLESLPFYEKRTSVPPVLEHLPVYRVRTAGADTGEPGRPR